MNHDLERYLVEFLGSVFFLYVILSTGNYLAIGLALSLVVLLGGSISGGNFNPAVTIMMALAGKQPMSDIIPYSLCQIAGGLVAIELYNKNIFW